MTVQEFKVLAAVAEKAGDNGGATAKDVEAALGKDGPSHDGIRGTLRRLHTRKLATAKPHKGGATRYTPSAKAKRLLAA